MKLKSLFLFLAVLFPALAFAQSGDVTGKVIDSYGEPVFGAAVIEKGSTNGTLTDMDGAFSLKVKTSSATLVVSCLSYRDAEVSATVGSPVSIVLEDDSQALEEVVVVGYGTQKKVNLTGSVTSIAFDDKVNSRPITSVSSALNGLSAGVAVTQSSGKPGESATIRVRGTGTLNDSQPLVLVDGVEWDMDSVNPGDIENISILKDASSTAIYGALGANGVILITTKRGKGEPKFAYNGYVSLEKAINKLSYVDNYVQHMELANENMDMKGQMNAYSQSSIETWRYASEHPDEYNEFGILNSIAYPNTNWFDVIFAPALSQNHHISMSGSSDKINYSFAAGLLDNPGVMNVVTGQNSGEKKVTFQSRVDGKVGDWLTVGMNIQGRRSSFGLTDVSSTFKDLAAAVPGIYPGGEGMKFGGPTCVDESTTAANPVRSSCGSDGTNIFTEVNLSGYFSANLYKGLVLDGKYNYQLSTTNKHQWNTHILNWNFTEDYLLSETNLASSYISESSSKTERTNVELILRYNTSIGKHNIGAIAGYTGQEYSYRATSASRMGMTAWELHELSTASTLQGSSGSSTEWAMNSFFGRINYNWDERYLFEVNARYDGSSRFSPESRWGFFPSFSAGWRINKEEWMEDAAGWLNNLKLRASYGKVGNNRTSDYAWQARYKIAKVIAEGSATSALVVGKIGNNALEWESTTAADLGVDFGMFDNRFTGEIDIYNKDTYGILYTPTMYMTMGWREGSTQNLASLNNKGLELTLNWNSRIGEFFYSVGGNISFNRTMVTKYKGKLQQGWEGDVYKTNIGEVVQDGFGGKILEDHILGEHYLLKLYHGNGKGYDGIGDVDPNAGPVDGMIRTETDREWAEAMMAAGYRLIGQKRFAKSALWYGDYIYEDVNGDGYYGDTNDHVLNGHSNTPLCNYAINITMAWKGFDFYALLSGAAGFWLFSIPNLSPSVAGVMYKYVADDHYYYNPNNPFDEHTNLTATYPRLGGTNMSSNENFEFKGDYLKLKNIQLGYTIPKRLTERVKIDKCRFYISADNVFTLTQYPGMDPEIGASVGYPLMKQYAAGMQLTF